MVGGEPDGVLVGLAGLRPTGLAHVGVNSSAIGDQRAGIDSGTVGEPDDQLKVGADAGDGRRLFLTSCRSP